MTSENACPYGPDAPGAAAGSRRNRDWWPNQLDLSVLHRQPSSASPLPDAFDYAREFSKLDLSAVKHDIEKVMTTSQPWWPADYGHYGPLFIRMAWHSAGTYRISDGRGGAGAGAQRFAPLNSWPDNVNLDKARRLLWPIKRKYGRRLSWADLMILAGNCALESMGLATFGFGGGRVDAWEPEDIYWGHEDVWLADDRYHGDRELENPLGAVQMGLIYVNPEGPNGNPDPLAAARDIRETFARMAMDDVETVALIAGGHTFGKTHGAADPAANVGPEPEAAPLHEQGLGWRNRFGTGHGDDTITSGLEGAWTEHPARWDNNFLENLFHYDWVQTKSPAGATQWIPTDPAAASKVPDPHDATRQHPPVMLTTDLALRFDPAYEKIARGFLSDPDSFADAFARAWFKLTHRDMGPLSRYLGPEVPHEELIWQDPVPPVAHKLIGRKKQHELKEAIAHTQLAIPSLVRVAWASASTFRCTDKRGGANGARVRLAPQRDWAVNDPAELHAVLATLEAIQREYNATHTSQVSLADLIVLAGGGAIERAAEMAGVTIEVPFTPGRTDASEQQTDVASFAVLEPTSDGFRNYHPAHATERAEVLLVERAARLGLTAPEMSVLVGGLRALGANTGGSSEGVFTRHPGVLTNEFFVNLLDDELVWHPTDDHESHFVGSDRTSGAQRWTASRVDLVFGSHAQLRAIAEFYGSDDGRGAFISDFVAAWVKVMEADRFDLD